MSCLDVRLTPVCRRSRVAALALLFLVYLAPLPAEVWRTTTNAQIEGKLSDVLGGTAVLSTKTGANLVPLDQLDDAGTARVADFLSAEASPRTWATSESKVAKSVRGRLQVLRAGKLVPFDATDQPEPHLYLVYFGAHWCGPCREFSPDLVKAYKQLKAAAPDAFELVFISHDRDADEQALYARAVWMPWLVLKYSSVGRVAPLERWAGPGIPSLVAVTREGDVIFNSYHGSEYVGPRLVLQQFTELLRTLDGKSDAVRRARHPVAVLQHVRAAGADGSSVKPYAITLDLSRYQTLQVKELRAQLEIDERGHVSAAKFEPEIPPVLAYQLERDAESWLFLPAAKDGRATAVKVVLPLKL